MTEEVEKPHTLFKDKTPLLSEKGEDIFAVDGCSNYGVSASGNVYLLKRIDSGGTKVVRIIEGVAHKYHSHTLREMHLVKDDGKALIVNRAKLIANVFNDNPHGYEDVRFKDGNTENLNHANLEYCPKGEGELYKPGRRNGSIAKRAVVARPPGGGELEHFQSLGECARAIGCTLAEVSHVCGHRPHRRTVKNWKIAYADDADAIKAMTDDSDLEISSTRKKLTKRTPPKKTDKQVDKDIF